MSINTMKLALEALELAGGNLCEALHHPKKLQHGIGEPCPAVAKYDEAIAALRQAIEQASENGLYREGYRNGYGFGEAAGLRQAIEQAQKQEPVACFNGMPAYEGALSKAQRKQLTQDLNAPLTLNGIALRPLSETKAVIDAARAAMDDSAEAYDSEGSIKISPHLAASLSLCLDKYDKAIEQAQEQEALNRKAENARELGLDYEPEPVRLECVVCGTVYADGVPPQTTQKQEPVAWMRDDEMKAMVSDEKRAWILCGQLELINDYNKPLYTSPQVAEPQPQRQPLVIDSKEKASEFIEKTLWEVIDVAAMFPKAKPDPRTWEHLMAYAPQRQPLKLDELWRVFTRSGLSQFHQRDGVVEYKYERCIEEFARAIEAAHGIKE
jgi:tetratricopeptide (TPR) repeat protein